jgi:hypothetical protein
MNLRVHTIKRKIFIDALGIVLSALALAGSFSGYARASAWLLALTFVIANIYLLAIRPMYQISSAG